MSEKIDWPERLRAWCKSNDRNLPIEEICETLEVYDRLKAELEKSESAVASLVARLKELEDACNESWNAFENGKRKHHTDALTGKCILGCQACAIEKLNKILKKK